MIQGTSKSRTLVLVTSNKYLVILNGADFRQSNSEHVLQLKLTEPSRITPYDFDICASRTTTPGTPSSTA